jgi:hypothetical protein
VTVVPIGGEEAPWEPGQGPSNEPRPTADLAPAADLTAVADPTEPPELVLVTWRDAWFDFDVADPEETHADYLVRTVGFLVRRGPRFVSIAQEVLPDGDGFRAITHIPVEIVASMVPLLEPEGSEEQDLAAP